MGTFRVVVRDELSEDQPEVLLVKDDQVVEALVPEGPDDSLRNRIGSRCLHRVEQDLDALAPGTQLVAWLPTPRRGFEELPPSPGGGRVRREVNMDHLPAHVRDEHDELQDVHCAKGQRLHGEQ